MVLKMQTTKDFIKDIPKIYRSGWREFKGLPQKIIFFITLPLTTFIVIMLIIVCISSDIIDKIIKKFTIA